jgi:ribose transport system permease protein
VVEGITLGYTNANTQYGHSGGFANLGTGSVLGIPNLVIAFILVTLVVHLVLRYSTLGFRFAATGAGLEAARAAGLRVRRVVALAFLLSGVAAAIAGLMQAALLNSVNYDTGDSYTFISIAAVAIGGTSLFGGSGSAVRTLGGVALIGLLDNIVVLYGLPLPLQTLLTGVVILAAVVVDRLTREETR